MKKVYNNNPKIAERQKEIDLQTMKDVARATADGKGQHYIGATVQKMNSWERLMKLGKIRFSREKHGYVLKNREEN